jgi:hypothetical protein
MLRLDTTTRSLQVALGATVTTAQLPVMVSYSDKTSTTYVGATQVANTNNTTLVTVASAPAASTIRDVDYLSIRNADSMAATVTINMFDTAGSVTTTLVSASLAAGDTLFYTHASGWHSVDRNGLTKTSYAGPVSPAVGGGTDQVFLINDQTVTTSFSIPASHNAISAGPITINDGATVTIPTGSAWVIA